MSEQVIEVNRKALLAAASAVDREEGRYAPQAVRIECDSPRARAVATDGRMMLVTDWDHEAVPEGTGALACNIPLRDVPQWVFARPRRGPKVPIFGISATDSPDNDAPAWRIRDYLNGSECVVPDYGRFPPWAEVWKAVVPPPDQRNEYRTMALRVDLLARLVKACHEIGAERVQLDMPLEVRDEKGGVRPLLVMASGEDGVTATGIIMPMTDD